MIGTAFAVILVFFFLPGTAGGQINENVRATPGAACTGDEIMLDITFTAPWPYNLPQAALFKDRSGWAEYFAVLPGEIIRSGESNNFTMVTVVPEEVHRPGSDETIPVTPGKWVISVGSGGEHGTFEDEGSFTVLESCPEKDISVRQDAYTSQDTVSGPDLSSVTSLPATGARSLPMICGFLFSAALILCLGRLRRRNRSENDRA